MRLKKKDFVEILNRYNIGGYVGHNYLEDVLENDVYVVFTTRGKFIFKLLTKVNLKDFRDQLKFIDFLYSKNILVVKNIRDKNGVETVKYSGVSLVVQKFINGVHPKGFSNPLIKDIAKAIGRMHKVLLKSKFAGAKKHKYEKRRIVVCVDIQKKLMDDLKKINFKKLKTARIHGDLSEVNMLVSKNKLNVFIDFDDSDYDYLVYELAVFLAHAFVRSDAIYWNKIKLFLDGYCRYVKLNDEELKAIYYMIKYRLIGILYWHVKYIKKCPKKKSVLSRGLKRSQDRLVNFEKTSLDKFLERLK